MATTIQKQVDTPILHRKEVIIITEYEAATPSKEESKKLVAQQVKADPSVVIIKKVESIYGSKKAAIKAYIYESAEFAQAIEPPAKKKEDKAAKPAEDTQSAEKAAEKPKQEKPAEKAAEKPKEAPKEQKKAEDKK